MCTPFTIVRVNVTGSSNDFGFEAAGLDIRLMRGAMPKGTTSPVGYWQVADIAVEPADLTGGGRTDEPHSSVFALGVDAL